MTPNSHIKPGKLVFVNTRNTKGYHHFGEVMSYPTPGATAMVRAVPGDPSTLIEVPVSVLSPAEDKRYVHYAEVFGVGSLPIDMLRYDYAAPVNFDITDEYPYYVMKPADDPARLGWPTDHPVIATVTRTKSPHWTGERWRSFLWNIKTLVTSRIPGC